MKKLFRVCFLLAVLALFAVAASCESSGTCGENVTWTLDDVGTLTISGTGDMTDYLYSNVPWDSSSSSVKKVVIESGVTSIGYSAFSGCTGLTSITIPDSVTSIGGFAFSNTALTSVMVPSGVTSIGSTAFAACFNMTEINVDSANPSYCSKNGVLFSKDGKTLVAYPTGRTGVYTIPNGVTSIGNYAFGHSRLDGVSIPSSVTSIKSDGFWNCSMNSITIPSSVTSIGRSSFAACFNMTEINVDSANPSYCSQNGVVFSKDGKTLVAYPAGKKGSYTIPNSVTNIGEFAFSNCINLPGITIPSGVTTIDYYAFGYCTGLLSVTLPDGLTKISNAAFSGCINLVKISIPGSVIDIGAFAFSNCGKLSSVIFRGNAPEIDSYTFSNITATAYYPRDNATWTEAKQQNYRGSMTWKAYTSENEVELDFVDSGTCGANLTWILDFEGMLTISGTGAMEDYVWDTMPWKDYQSSINAAVIKPGVTSIGEYAFGWCFSLTSVTIPSSVITISDCAFVSCASLTSITIPASVSSIGVGAFDECTSLTSINISSANTTYSSKNGVLFSKDGKTLYVYPGGKSGAYTIPTSVTSIGEDAFFLCSSLTSVTIPSSVTSIDRWAFGYCDSLTSIEFQGSAPEIIDRAFYRVTATVYYPADDPTWTEDVRQNYGGDLTWVAKGMSAIPTTWNLILPSGLTSIGEEAFLNDTSMTNICLSENCTAIGANAFKGCTGLQFVCIPNTNCTIAGDAFGGNTSVTIVTAPGSPTAQRAEAMGLTVVDING